MSVRFGEFEFDRSARELRSRGRAVRLQEQPFQVLDLLLEKAGAVVTREELHRRLWPSKVYYDVDHGLNNAITRLREVLRDSAERPRYIETIPKVGYRFVAPLLTAPDEPGCTTVTPQTVAGSAPAAAGGEVARAGDAPAKKKLTAAALAGVAVAVCGLAAAAIGSWRWMPSHRSVHSVAVLPFENLSTDPGQDYFVDGMTDALITDLAKINALNVISRTTAMHYKGVHQPIGKLGAELKVDAVVEGSIVRAGQQVHVNVLLVRAADDRHLWAQSYDRDLVSVIALQNELAQAVAEAVSVTLSPQDRGRIAHAHIAPPHAYDDYLRGMHLVNQASKESELASIPFFNSAIAADGQFAAAYAGLAQAYAVLGGETLMFGLRRDQALPRALAAARKAVALDPQLAEAWSALGMVLDRSGPAGNGDPLLRTAIERALALSPGDAWAHKRHGDFLLDHDHDVPAALREYQQSLRLDPLNARTNSIYGETLLDAGRIQEGFAQLRKSVQLNPWALVPHMKLGFALVDHRRYEEAIVELRKAEEISPKSLPVEVNLADAEALAGHAAEAEALLSSIVPLAEELGRPSAVALIEVRLHHRTEALVWLQRSIDARDDFFFQWSGDADWLATDPEFQALARKAKELPAAQAITDNASPDG